MKYSELVYLRLNGISHWYSKSCLTFKSLLGAEAEVITEWASENKEQSSEKNLTSDNSL